VPRLRGGRSGAEKLELVEGAVIGALEGVLIADQLGEGVSAAGIADPGQGDGVGGAGFVRRQRGFLIGAQHASLEGAEEVGIIGAQAGVGTENARFHGGEALEAPRSEHHAIDQELFGLGGGPVEAAEPPAEPGEGGGILAGQEDIGGEGPMPKGIEANDGLTGRGPGAGGFEGVAAVGIDAGLRSHRVFGTGTGFRPGLRRGIPTGAERAADREAAGARQTAARRAGAPGKGNANFAEQSQAAVRG